MLICQKLIASFNINSFNSVIETAKKYLSEIKKPLKKDITRYQEHMERHQECSKQIIKLISTNNKNLYNFFIKLWLKTDFGLAVLGNYLLFEFKSQDKNELIKNKTVQESIKNNIIPLLGFIYDLAKDISINEYKALSNYHDIYKLVNEDLHEPYSAYVYRNVFKQITIDKKELTAEQADILEVIIYSHALPSLLWIDNCWSALDKFYIPYKLEGIENYSVKELLQKVTRSPEQKINFLNRFIISTLIDTGAALGNGFIFINTVKNYQRIYKILIEQNFHDERIFLNIAHTLTNDDFIQGLVNGYFIWTPSLDTEETQIRAKKYIQETINKLNIPQDLLNLAKEHSPFISQYHYMHPFWCNILCKNQKPSLDEITIDNHWNFEDYVKFRILLTFAVENNTPIKISIDTNKYQVGPMMCKNTPLDKLLKDINILWNKLINNYNHKEFIKLFPKKIKSFLNNYDIQVN